MDHDFKMHNKEKSQVVEVEATQGAACGVRLGLDDRFGGASLVYVHMAPESALLLAGALERAALKARRDEAAILAEKVERAERGNLAEMGQVGALAKVG